jgi:hypothetical protein
LWKRASPANTGVEMNAVRVDFWGLVGVTYQRDVMAEALQLEYVGELGQGLVSRCG